jgi:2-polyprenyl-3-methyl-5-hydroxy-6-metoxy-1,4-benzoquinol methylase
MGLREEFEYVECSNCGCLFIKVMPEDIGKYYDTDYEPHKHEDNFFDKFSKKIFGMYIANNPIVKSIFDKRVTITTRFWNSLVDKKLINLDSAILDVGCGDGNFLNILKKGGFKNLTGFDLFIDDDNMLEGITIYKSSLEDFKSDKKFDLITSNHSFEHMDNQLINLQCFENLVKDEGIVVIRIPIKSDFFWNRYGVNWHQIDAPRHFFLHTIESFKILCSKTI